MSDIDLLRKFREIDSNIKSKIGSLENLKSRIETEMFLAESQNPFDARISMLIVIETDLNFVNTCISEYKDKTLTADSMVHINKLNKRYRRNK